MKHWTLIGTLALSTTAWLVPGRAEACGGFFCDGGPQPMPVDQSGEDILFVADGDTVEVHIRIQYEGEPQNFAWVIPVLSAPTGFAVGSEQLFDRIKAGSVPTYGVSRTFDTCGDDGGFGGALTGGGFPGGAGTGGLPPGAPDDAGGPTIVLQETVGAFEITVLEGGTATELIDWLDSNGYLQDPDAEPIFEEYLDEGHLFAAIKLQGGAGVEELHPIALTFDHSEPCVPLRLTRIAAKEDMDVRTYFLGDARVVPMNYRHVLVNPLQIDWPSQANNYKDVITLAVDADHADGRAFVTEYAGPSSVVFADQLAPPQWDAGAFEGVTAVQAIDLLSSQGLWTCDEFGAQFGDALVSCFSNHPLVEGLVAEFLPVPEGVEPLEFYLSPALFEGLIDELAWDSAMFARLLAERVVDPARHAVELLETNPFLTRMYTTISPVEMTVDPMFHENPDLDPVFAQQTATSRVLCSGDTLWTLPDGREVFVPQGAPWPNITDIYEEKVEEVPSFGAPVRLADRTDEIDAALDAYNEAQGWSAPAGDGGTGGSPPGGDGDDAADDGSGGSPRADGVSDRSSGCRAAGSPAGTTLALLGVLALWGRRRRRSSSDDDGTPRGHRVAGRNTREDAASHEAGRSVSTRATWPRRRATSTTP